MKLYDFLHQISLNNDRAWFAAHRAEYDQLRAQWLDQLQQLINQMSLWEPGLSRITAKDCAYRIYRDTRFSPDKSPLKTYFSALISPYGRKTDHAAYYLQIDCRPEENGLYGGLWCPEAPVLRKLRKAFVDNEEEIREILADPALEARFPGWCGRKLKTAPKGWPKDHPMVDLLRLNDVGKQLNVGRAYFEDPAWPQKAAEDFHLLKPLIDFINYSIDE